MNFERLRVFVEVAQCRSMNQAAKRLFVSQPTVSGMIKAMEEELGYTLIERSYRGVTLTEKGRRVFEDARKILAMEQQWHAIAETDPTISGDVHVTVVPSATPLVLQVVAALKKRYPTVNVIIHDGRKAHLLEMLVDQTAMVGIYGYPDDEKENVSLFADANGLTVETLLNDTFCVFVSARHPLAEQEVVTLTALRELPIAIYAGEDPVAPYFVKYFDESECYYMNNLDAMMNLALHGEAAAVCTCLYASYSPLVQEGLLKILNLEMIMVPFTYCLLYPADDAISATEAIVVEALRKAFDEQAEM